VLTIQSSPGTTNTNSEDFNLFADADAALLDSVQSETSEHEPYFRRSSTWSPSTSHDGEVERMDSGGSRFQQQSFGSNVVRTYSETLSEADIERMDSNGSRVLHGHCSVRLDAMARPDGTTRPDRMISTQSKDSRDSSSRSSKRGHRSPDDSEAYLNIRIRRSHDDSDQYEALRVLTTRLGGENSELRRDADRLRELLENQRDYRYDPERDCLRKEVAGLRNTIEGLTQDPMERARAFLSERATIHTVLEVSESGSAKGLSPKDIKDIPFTASRDDSLIFGFASGREAITETIRESGESVSESPELYASTESPSPGRGGSMVREDCGRTSPAVPPVIREDSQNSDYRRSQERTSANRRRRRRSVSPREAAATAYWRSSSRDERNSRGPSSERPSRQASEQLEFADRIRNCGSTSTCTNSASTLEARRHDSTCESPGRVVVKTSMLAVEVEPEVEPESPLSGSSWNRHNQNFLPTRGITPGGPSPTLSQRSMGLPTPPSAPTPRSWRLERLGKWGRTPQSCHTTTPQSSKESTRTVLLSPRHRVRPSWPEMVFPQDDGLQRTGTNVTLLPLSASSTRSSASSRRPSNLTTLTEANITEAAKSRSLTESTTLTRERCDTNVTLASDDVPYTTPVLQRSAGAVLFSNHSVCPTTPRDSPYNNPARPVQSRPLLVDLGVRPPSPPRPATRSCIGVVPIVPRVPQVALRGGPWSAR